MSALDEAIVELAPGEQWEMFNNDLATLVWRGDPAKRPSDAAILARAAQIAGRPAKPAPLGAEEVYDMLVAKGVLQPADRPRPRG